LFAIDWLKKGIFVERETSVSPSAAEAVAAAKLRAHDVARRHPGQEPDTDGVDYRPLPLGERKGRLARLVDRRLTGIVMNDHTDASGDLVFQQACRMGLEGIVSKRLSKPYQSGRSGHWLKVKNPDGPAMVRAREIEW
jgi:ATP dependent DNA ligase domain